MEVLSIKNDDPHSQEYSTDIDRAVAGIAKAGEKYKDNVTHIVAFG